MISFIPWEKTPRLFRDITITELIDGTNVAVIISKTPGPDKMTFTYTHATVSVGDETFYVGAQSRNRLMRSDDNIFGFSDWVRENAEDLVKYLGIGHHFGEWWGAGIQRKYGLKERRFSLLNTARYEGNPGIDAGVFSTVPVLWHGPFDEGDIRSVLHNLKLYGSKAAPGFMNPEGIVVFHEAAGQVFKVTIDADDRPGGGGGSGFEVFEASDGNLSIRPTGH